jgi:hypothetical protein
MPQPLPTRHTPWEHSAQAKLIASLPPECEWMAARIRERAEVGAETYGTYLGVGNPGRDANRDLQEELLDAMVYATERYLATGKPRYLEMRSLAMQALMLLGEG